MAWRPNENLIEGELDNRVQGKVQGWLDFYRGRESPLHVTFDLEGDFHRDIAGYRVGLRNRRRPTERQRGYMNGFSPEQHGVVGDMTAGWAVDGDVPYVRYPYFEWYADNGRVVLEGPEVAVLDGELRKVSREQVVAQQRQREEAMRHYLEGMAQAMRRMRGGREH